jgi:hypothetical protein
MLCGEFAVLQAPTLDGLSFDAIPFSEDVGTSAQVDVGRRQIIQALVVAMVVVVSDERLDLRLQVAGQSKHSVSAAGAAILAA